MNFFQIRSQTSSNIDLCIENYLARSLKFAAFRAIKEIFQKI